ncbi:C40 family peptidase [Rhodanobacter sp. Col0626]|uniref:C40 family peptidase n=1 Tax=Rhodanobacter sp. Col0626 TaxID=3415679 RepID=UPI003CF41A53
MPIKRLTAFSVLAAALLVIAPVQAHTSKTHGKPVHAKHAQVHKSTHVKTAKHKATHTKHGKLAATKHKVTHHSSLAASRSHAVPASTKVETTATVSPAASLVSSFEAGPQAIANVTPQLLQPLPIFNPAPMLSQSIVPADARTVLGGDDAVVKQIASGQPDADDQAADDESAPTDAVVENTTDLRKALIAMAMKLRDTRYVRGGHDPSTGFDCSGFVRYVFAHAVGMQLPTNSAAQFLAGLKIKRGDMKPGDLVFFRTHGKRRISHVGIYISNGRFIHSPTTGKSVEISSLNDTYWSKRFAGAKRPEAMAMVADKG